MVLSSAEQARVNLTPVLLPRLPVRPTVVRVSAASSSAEATAWGTEMKDLGIWLLAPKAVGRRGPGAAPQPSLAVLVITGIGPYWVGLCCSAPVVEC